MNIEARREHEPQDGSMGEPQDRHADIRGRLPLMGYRKNELRKTAHIPAQRNEYGIAIEQ